MDIPGGHVKWGVSTLNCYAYFKNSLYFKSQIISHFTLAFFLRNAKDDDDDD